MAAEGYFDKLCSLLLEEEEDAETFAEALLVRSVLSKHMTYLDTSRLAHIKDKANWPKNWARDSEPASFMDEVLNGPVRDVKRAYRVQKRMEDSVAAGIKQYGALFAMWMVYQQEVKGEDFETVADRFFTQCGVRMTDEHLDRLISMAPDDKKEEVIAGVNMFRQQSARWIENNPEN